MNDKPRKLPKLISIIPAAPGWYASFKNAVDEPVPFWGLYEDPSGEYRFVSAVTNSSEYGVFADHDYCSHDTCTDFIEFVYKGPLP